MGLHATPPTLTSPIYISGFLEKQSVGISWTPTYTFIVVVVLTWFVLLFYHECFCHDVGFHRITTSSYLLVRNLDFLRVICHFPVGLHVKAGLHHLPGGTGVKPKSHLRFYCFLHSLHSVHRQVLLTLPPKCLPYGKTLRHLHCYLHIRARALYWLNF